MTRDLPPNEHRVSAEPYSPNLAFAVIGGALALLGLIALLVVIV